MLGEKHFPASLTRKNPDNAVICLKPLELRACLDTNIVVLPASFWPNFFALQVRLRLAVTENLLAVNYIVECACSLTSEFSIKLCILDICPTTAV